MSEQASPRNFPSIADRARHAADRIVNIHNDLVASYQFTGADQRVHHLESIGTEIWVSMLPVMNWIERKRSAETAKNIKFQLHQVLHEAVECSRYAIPEFLGGVKRRERDSIRPKG